MSAGAARPSAFSLNLGRLARAGASERRAFRAWAARINIERVRVIAACTIPLSALSLLFNGILAESVLNQIANAWGLAGWVLILAAMRHRRWRLRCVRAYVGVLAVYLALLGASVSQFGFNPMYNSGVFLFAMILVLEPRTMTVSLAMLWALSVSPYLFIPVYPPSLLGHVLWTVLAWLASRLLFSLQLDNFLANRELGRHNHRLAAANVLLKDTNDRLALLNREKSELMAIAAHEIKSPLAGVAALLRMIAADATARSWTAGAQALEAVQRSCADIAALVGRFVEAHEVESHPGNYDLALADVREAVRHVALEHQERVHEKRIALDLDLPGEGCVAWVNMPALTQILDNLVSNAVKFSPTGGRVIVALSKAPDAIRVRVTDDGPGIAAEDRPKLFQKFRRLRARPTGGESSSGMGLFIVKKLVEAMGGLVSCESAPSGGATFEVALRPASSRPVAPVAQAVSG